MNIFETIQLIKINLEEQRLAAGDSDPLEGYSILTNPYTELSQYVPLILIEAESTEFINAEYGCPVAQDHHLSVTLFESAQQDDFGYYKKAVNDKAKNLIDMLMLIEDHRVKRIVPAEMSHAEINLGSLKTTGIVISITVRTDWCDS